MVIPGILGFYSVLLLSVLIIFLFIRYKWRNTAARKEEVMHLLAQASRESALAEFQVAAGYSSFPKVYQCAVCFSPTITRCSRCKAVYYCCGKCQIIHWRRGHKDDCRPPTSVVNFKEETGFDGKATSQNQFENCGDDSGVLKSMVQSEELSMIDNDDNLQPPEDATGKDSGFSLSRTIDARSESSVHASSSELLGSMSADSPENSISVDAASGIHIRPHVKQTRSTHSDWTNLANHENNVPYMRKLNQLKSIQHDEQVDMRSHNQEDKMGRSSDVQAEKLGNKKSPRATTSQEILVEGTSRFKNSPSVSCLRSDFVTKDGHENPKISRGKKVRSLSFGASGDFLSSATGAHAATTSVSVLPAKVSGVPNFPQRGYNGLKASVWKVAQQFRPSKSSKSYWLGSGSEVTGRYTCKIIFPYELFVRLYSCDGVELSPFGLINCGNSCYANAVLQCLAFTRPLTSYLLRGLHSKTCQKKNWCFICELESLILQAVEGKSPLSPIRILSKIQKIGKNLGHGKEEDAHEFLRCAVDTMQSVCLKEADAAGSLAEETTLVGLTFGGYLHSKIKCMNCLGKSECYERMMDLTVEIDGDIGSLEEALAQFTASEILDGEDRYYCIRCKSYERAKKKLTVLEAPNILIIVLKRFQSGNFGKLNKPVRFPEVLNMAPYMSSTSDKLPVYSLYAVVVHLDVMNATISGHYVCYVKNFRGQWSRIDDSTVMPVELESVLLECAYMLLYARHSPRAPALVRNNLDSYGARLKGKNLEAVPSSNASKVKSCSSVPRVDASTARQRHGKNPYWMTLDGPISNPSFDLNDLRFHSMRRIPTTDSSSESSSLFSCSDVSSCSTASTKSSSQTEDFSDYLFGEVGPSWYNHYGVSNIHSGGEKHA